MSSRSAHPFSICPALSTHSKAPCAEWHSVSFIIGLHWIQTMMGFFGILRQYFITVGWNAHTYTQNIHHSGNKLVLWESQLNLFCPQNFTLLASTTLVSHWSHEKKKSLFFLLHRPSPRVLYVCMEQRFGAFCLFVFWGVRVVVLLPLYG